MSTSAQNISSISPQCLHEDDPDKKPIARLISGTPQVPATKLEIYAPLPLIVIDEILMSALIVERRRLTPREGSANEELFN